MTLRDTALQMKIHASVGTRFARYQDVLKRQGCERNSCVMMSRPQQRRGCGMRVVNKRVEESHVFHNMGLFQPPRTRTALLAS